MSEERELIYDERVGVVAVYYGPKRNCLDGFANHPDCLYYGMGHWDDTRKEWTIPQTRLDAAKRIYELLVPVRSARSGEANELLAQLRAVIMRFKEGTQPRPRLNGIGKHKRAAEIREVETIHKTLNVVLAEIDKLSAGAGAARSGEISPDLLRDRLQQFVDRERALRNSTGGQSVGNSPSITPSVLKELERMLRDTPPVGEIVPRD